MQNKKQSTKRSLLVSGLALLLSVVLLIGTTLAWFTDSVVNKGNVITSGNLSIDAFVYDVDMTGGDKEFTVAGVNNGEPFKFETAGQDLKAENCPPVISETKWEPGQSNAKLIEVKNGGDLAAKIKLSFATEDGGLMNALWFDFIQVGRDGSVTGKFEKRPMNMLSTVADALELPLMPKGEDGDTIRFILVYGMDETAGNEYMNKSFSADVTVTATQYTYETDGFGSPDYDAAAPLDFAYAATADELADALALGKTVYLTEDVVLTDVINTAGDVTIIGNGNTIKSAPGADRVFNINDNTEPVTITLSRVNLKGPSTGTNTRGISLYNNAQPVKLVMDDCSVDANYYAINVASANANVEAVIRNSEITGWCAFQTHSPNTKVTFENCTLKGINDKPYNADGWNNFATVVINGYTNGNPDLEGAHDCTLTFKNCRLEATQTTGNRQLLFSVRAMNTTINLENCTFFIDGKQIESTREAVEPHIGVNSMEIAEALTVNFQ